MIISDNGFVGIAGSGVEKGDLIAYLFGMRMPIILRRRAENGYIIVGWAYVSGLMDTKILNKYDEMKLFEGLETTFDIY